MNKKKTIKAALYLRVDTTQATKKQILHMGGSLFAQEKVCRDFCKAQGIVVSEEHIYRDVCSGTLAMEERPALKKLFQATETGNEFDVVIVPKLDRLARNTNVLFSVLDRFAQEGVGLRSSTEQFDTNVGGGIIIRLLGAIAQMERDVISKRKHECPPCR